MYTLTFTLAGDPIPVSVQYFAPGAEEAAILAVAHLLRVAHGPELTLDRDGECIRGLETILATLAQAQEDRLIRAEWDAEEEAHA